MVFVAHLCSAVAVGMPITMSPGMSAAVLVGTQTPTIAGGTGGRVEAAREKLGQIAREVIPRQIL